MTPWISARRADAFESQASSPANGSEPVGSDTDLLELVQALRTLESPAPRPEFLTSLREQLMAEADTVLVAVPAGERTAADRAAARLTLPARNPRRQRRLVAAVGSVVLIGAGSTMAVAAQSALPGDGLYPIKRLVESARTSVTFSETGKGEQQLDHARARLSEAADLIAKGSPASLGQLPDTLETFTSQATEGADTLLAGYANGDSTGSVTTVRSFVASSLASLQALQPLTPADALPALQAAARSLVGIDASARALCPTCGDELADYSALLAAAVVDPSVVLPTPDAGATTGPDTSPEPGTLPTIDPQAVASANATTGPSTQPSQAPTDTETSAPTKSPDAKPTPPTTSKPSASSSPTSTPLLEALLGGTSTDGTTTGVVPGLLGTVGGIVGGLLGTVPKSTPSSK